MKIKIDKTISISFKTPDVLDFLEESVRVVDEDGEYVPSEDITEEMRDEREDIVADLKEKLKKWIHYGECITVDYDTEEDEMKIG